MLVKWWRSIVDQGHGCALAEMRYGGWNGSLALDCSRGTSVTVDFWVILLTRGARALGRIGGLALFGGHLVDVFGVGAILAVECGLVQRDLLVRDLALLGRRLLILFGLLNNRQELDTREHLQLLVALTVLCFVEFAVNDLEDLADMGECLVHTEIRQQETLPAHGHVVDVSNKILFLLS